MNRQTMSISMDVEKPAMSEPAMNRNIPARKMGFRPNLSLILPAMGW